MAAVIRADDLGKRYALGERWASRRTLRETVWQALRAGRSVREHVWAIRHVDLEVHGGDAVGLIGGNGAGKSTLLRVLARVTEPTEGRSMTRGRVGALLDVGTGFHPELTGRENVYLNGAILGMDRQSIRRVFEDIVAFSGVERFLDTPVKRYSSGMHTRLAFSVAAHLDADILLVDEVLAVGDAEFQRRCLTRMDELRADGRTVLFASHDLQALARLCPRAVWLRDGVVAGDGPSGAVISAYLDARLEHHRRRRFEPDGSGPVAARSLAIEPAAAAPDGSITTGEALELAVEFDVRSPVAGLTIGAYVMTAGGVRVIDETANVAGDVCPAGSYAAVLSVPGVLGPGEYSVGLWLGTEHDDLVWVDEAASFVIQGERQRMQTPILALGGPWVVETRPASPTSW